MIKFLLLCGTGALATSTVSNSIPCISGLCHETQIARNFKSIDEFINRTNNAFRELAFDSELRCKDLLELQQTIESSPVGLQEESPDMLTEMWKSIETIFWKPFQEPTTSSEMVQVRSKGIFMQSLVTCSNTFHLSIDIVDEELRILPDYLSLEDMESRFRESVAFYNSSLTPKKYSRYAHALYLNKLSFVQKTGLFIEFIQKLRVFVHFDFYAQVDRIHRHRYPLNELLRFLESAFRKWKHDLQKMNNPFPIDQQWIESAKVNVQEFDDIQKQKLMLQAIEVSSKQMDYEDSKKLLLDMYILEWKQYFFYKSKFIWTLIPPVHTLLLEQLKFMVAGLVGLYFFYRTFRFLWRILRWMLHGILRSTEARLTLEANVASMPTRRSPRLMNKSKH